MLDRFHARGAEVVALAVQEPERARTMAELLGNPFPILADAAHQAAEAYGVFNLLGDGIAAPAVFIIDPAGKITWSYIGRNAEDRPTAALLLEHLP
jgi:peroxiredoxin